MANKTYGNYLLGVRDAKVATASGTTAIDVDAIQSVTMELEFTEEVLVGDDVQKAAVSSPVGGTCTFSAGAVSDEFIETVTGNSFAATGTTPNEVNTFTLSAGDRMPYFKFKSQAYDDKTGAAVLFLPKCKLTGGLNVTFENGAFFVQEFTVRLFDDGANGIFQLAQEETATALSFS